MLAGGNDTVTVIHDGPASTVARYEALIRVSEALRAYHDRDALFRSLARELRPVVRFSFLGLGLYDEHTRGLDLRVLEATGNPLPFGWEWRRVSTALVSNTVSERFSFFEFVNTNAPGSTISGEKKGEST